jgi:hypothetical protein
MAKVGSGRNFVKAKNVLPVRVRAFAANANRWAYTWRKKERFMAGFDRAVLMEKLIALGWKEAPANVDCDSLSHACLVPPDSLWQNKPKAFYVYDARDLQDLLGESVPEDDDTPNTAST